jgi:SAM-dependent methyltransferase
MNCRHCRAPLTRRLIDLGAAPPSNAYLTAEALHAPERWYPLRVLVCESCWLVQTEDFAAAEELFSADYAYFSGFSATWIAHVEAYVAAMVERFALGPQSHVVEVAANDGSLLQIVRQRGIRCLGIEPTTNTANAARTKELEIIEAFFGIALARRLAAGGWQADLIAANNVLAHVPDINDFVGGFPALLKPTGVATFEFPHLLHLLADNQFDTIYHEHFSYLSLTAVARIFMACGLEIFDVEELQTHGGSLRVFAQRLDHRPYPRLPIVADMLERERDAGLRSPGGYTSLQQRAEQVKDDFLRFLLDAKRAGKKVAGYGAAAKGNTLLNFAGVRSDLLCCVADRNPAKQGGFLPGSRIPVVDEGHLYAMQPDYVVILPWNIRREVIDQLAGLAAAGCRFVTAVPRLEVLPLLNRRRAA